MALHDIVGQALGVPVYVLLGGAFRDRIAVAHSLGIMENDRAVSEAEQAVAEGVTTIKCKTGLDSKRDVALVEALRTTLGPEIALRVDANEGYRSVKEAIAITHAMEQFDILLTEQPVADAAEMAAIAAAIHVPVMADESAWTPQDILHLRDLRAAELISLYVAKPGGLYRARAVATVAEATGLRCDIGGSIEMGIGLAANLHLGAATHIAEFASVCPVNRPAEAYQGETAGVYYLDDIVVEPFDFVAGSIMVPQGPGLGIMVDERKLARYCVDA
jgi:muconate cycloisomerase